jgi:hypothetical protein
MSAVPKLYENLASWGLLLSAPADDARFPAGKYARISLRTRAGSTPVNLAGSPCRRLVA